MKYSRRPTYVAPAIVPRSALAYTAFRVVLSQAATSSAVRSSGRPPSRAVTAHLDGREARRAQRRPAVALGLGDRRRRRAPLLRGGSMLGVPSFRCVHGHGGAEA